MAATTSRYVELAGRIAASISDGTYGIGSRMPSVRDLCRQYDASITTIAAAYRLLERRGLVEPRPQSGHFVRAAPLEAQEPGVSQPHPRPTEVGLGELALMVMRDSLDSQRSQFGPALPDQALAPSVELERIIAGLARRGEAGTQRYDVPPGHRELRVRIARRAAAIGCDLGPDRIVTTAGALEALTLALRATCKAGDTVAIESPMYYGLLQSIESLALRVVEIPTHPRDGIVLEALREALDEHPIAAVVAMPNFNNPLGSRSSDDAKRELVELLGSRRIPLIEDDVLGDLAHDGTRPSPAKAFDRRGLVLWCSSFSKTAAPGLRVGWIAAGKFQAAVEHMKFTSSVATSTLSQVVMAEFLASGGYDRFLRRVRPAYGARCVAMAEAVARYFPRDTRVTRPTGGFVLWVELPRTVDAHRLYDAALDAQVSLTPGPLFSAKQRYRHFIRLNAAGWSQPLEPKLRTLGTLATRFAERGSR